MKITVIICMTAMILSCFSNAQSSSSVITDTVAKPRSTDRTFRIVFPERPNDSPKVAYLFDGKESQQVSLPSMNFSKVLVIPGGETTLLMTPYEITDLENLPLDAPRLNIPEGITDFYIFMSPDPSNNVLPLKMNLVNTSEGKLKPGETLWFNLTEHKIIAKLGDSKMSVAPKTSAVSKDPMPESGYYKAQFAFQPKAVGSFYKITEQQWWHDADSRHVGFVVPTGGRLPKIYYFRDFRL